MRDQLKWLQREWAVRLASAVESMTGESARTESKDGVAGPVESGAVIFRQPTDIGPDAQLWVMVPSATWSAIGAKVLESAGLEESSEEEARGTFLEVLQQSLSPLAQAIGARLKREVVFLAGAAEETAGQGLEWAQVSVVLAGVEYPALELSITPALGRALLVETRPSAPEQAAPAGDVKPESTPRAMRGSKTMDLLLEVELPVGVSFGRVQMKLRDAVKLTTGSIVELNRRVTEPVEVIVNNCVIARGEVVVVEGNYGVRIQEIVSREERLRTLF